MFQEKDVYANIPAEHHPERSAPSPEPQAAVPAAIPAYAPMGASPDGLGYVAERLEPPDTAPEGAVRSAGIATLGAAVAFGTGVATGGGWGGVAGVMLWGAILNGYRSQKWWGSPDPSEKHEAVVSGVMAALEVAGGLYAGYKAWQARSDDDG